MTAQTRSQEDERAIDKLSEVLGKVQGELTNLRVDIARSEGAYSTKLDEMSKDIKSLSELYARVATTEKDAALLRERFTNSETSFAAWRKDIETDMRALNRFMWMGIGGLGALQIAMSIFGETIRAALNNIR